MKALLLVSYDGTDFSGWQRQPGVRTVQQVMEEAAERAFTRHIALTASGRTDAGVHAAGQVIEGEFSDTIPPEKLRECLNVQLPSDVKVIRSCSAPDGFDVTRDAKRKTYCYNAYYAESELPLFSRYAARLKWRPDTEKMRLAAQLLVGEHDFAAFRAAGYTSKTSVRTLFAVTIEEKPIPGGTLFSVRVTGNGFLYNMVRILAGELFAIGCGKPEGITRAFKTGERSALSVTMPAQGLVLESADYGIAELLP